MDRRPVAEIFVCGLIIVVCGIFYSAAAKLPPGTFEPLGSGPVPKYTALIIIACCLLVIFNAVRKIARGPGLGADVMNEFRGRSPLGALVILGLTLGYILVLQTRILPFGVVTFGFLLLTIWVLEDLRLKALLPALIVSAIGSFGVEYLFTNVFYVDLPT
jgi:hypothetical protein